MIMMTGPPGVKRFIDDLLLSLGERVKVEAVDSIILLRFNE